MKKVVSIIIFCLVCCLTLGTTVFAAEAHDQNSAVVYVTDYFFV